MPMGRPQVMLLTGTLNLGSLTPGRESVSAAIVGVVIFPTGAGQLGLRLPQGKTRICLVSQQTGAAIPLAWELRYQTPSGWSQWMSAALGVIPNAGPALQWPIAVGAPVPCRFEARCRLKTAPLQLAGQYGSNVPLQFVAWSGQQ